MKKGNPFGPFWDNYDIDFNEFKEYSPLSYNTHTLGVRGMWEERYDIIVSGKRHLSLNVLRIRILFV